MTSEPGTAERLIMAAERLFAEHGVGAVSLRAVMTAAGVNVAAVHYHFGSKEALVEAVVRSRVDQVTQARSAALESIAGSASPTARELARALVGPVLEIARDGGRDWLKVIGSMLGRNDPGLAPVSETFFERNVRFVELMERHDPAASRATLGFRLAQAMNLTLQVLGDAESVRSLMTGTGTPWTQEEVVEQLLDVVVSILAGPPDESPTQQPRADQHL